MAKRIQRHSYHLFFCLFSYLADKSGGWSMFVRPKLVIGSLIVSLGLTFPEKTVAQQKSQEDKNGPKQSEVKDSTKQKNDISEPFCYIIEKSPEFPGGTEAILEFINNNLRYPKRLAKKEIEGTVICCFVVEKDGTLTHIEVIRTPHPVMGKEAVRIIKAMPKWKAGGILDSITPVKYALPIRFKLQNIK